MKNILYVVRIIVMVQSCCVQAMELSQESLILMNFIRKICKQD